MEYNGPERRAGNGSRRGNDNGWHLDRKVPVSLILAIFLQTAAAIWWISAMEERVGVVEEFVSSRINVPDRLSTIEANQNWLMRTTERIESSVSVLMRRATSLQE